MRIVIKNSAPQENPEVTYPYLARIIQNDDENLWLMTGKDCGIAITHGMTAPHFVHESEMVPIRGELTLTITD
jgi:hypothetical protein